MAHFMRLSQVNTRFLPFAHWKMFCLPIASNVYISFEVFDIDGIMYAYYSAT